MRRRDFVRDAIQLLATVAIAPCARVSGDGTAAAREPRFSRSLDGRASGTALFGSAVLISEIADGSPVAAVIARECRLIVPAGPLHWRYLRPDPSRFDFGPADACVAFATRHGLRLRGHTLVWHEMLPAWLPPVLAPSTAPTLMREHIATTVGRYRGQFHSWDVVNEAVSPFDRRADGLRVTPWLTAIGPSYIGDAFRHARAADPTTLLGYNEYGLESDDRRADEKRAAVLALLRRLVNDRAPIDYLGIQSHLRGGDSYSDRKLGSFLREVRALGLKVFITELDVDDGTFPGDDSARDAAVADVYDRYLSVAMASTEIPVVVTWGLTDRASWLQKHAPRRDGRPQRSLPFDDELRPKSAWGVLQRFILRPGSSS